MKISILFLCSLAIIGSCKTQTEDLNLGETAIVFENANVIDVRSGKNENLHVVVDGQLIDRLIPAGKHFDWGAAKVVDAGGKYLLPGLAEMHAHIPDRDWDDPLIAETLFLYLANGVTTIRGMLGQPEHLPLREKASSQEILSPRIFTSSPSLNGTTVRTPAEAREKVTAYANEGYDFLKLHPGIRKHVFDTLAKTAGELGIPYAGHVSNLVGIRHALANGYRTVDHIDGFLEGLVPEDAGVNPTENGFFGFNFTDLAERSNIEALVALSKENKVWVVPTQALFDRWFSPIPSSELAGEPEMKYMSKATRTNWIESKKNLTERGDFDAEKWQRFQEIRYQLIRSLQKEGQGLLLGSDAPQVFNVPGFSIHHELQGMLDAGLDPLEAIQIGTINPATFFGGNFGEIKKGMEADMILLQENPINDLEHLKNPLGVMVRGQWIDQNTIQKKLASIADKYE
ncbi:Amidohydrolase family protein [Cyclobacterium lianum]|uniref:Amidohydrolase family protein n=1 Tax=Cyclobacterium lianum TaxID=388280 RepID=A0A1M7NW44_9BACT|nr:amidohydrolase family protein [Cyclobacterium lianum]SHN08325.1 Amidohydrolase family protein [Cyclobacterium lianum]